MQHLVGMQVTLINQQPPIGRRLEEIRAAFQQRPLTVRFVSPDGRQLVEQTFVDGESLGILIRQVAAQNDADRTEHTADRKAAVSNAPTSTGPCCGNTMGFCHRDDY
eukprot:TRINITY_DN13381_c0_g1_i1.p1 TRINITY_DN13381_c0_g1~~TRINITY_DN13381_c0_g1_i1.p1  ORF type:complete len:107 (+),score=11.77 TRINITY_DN13381_c0_g1_i1:253-573(+)